MDQILDAKSVVLSAWLSFVNRFISLDRVRIATLGGHGIEAALWKTHGIQDENGWLIERSRKSFGALQHGGTQYHLTVQLKSLPNTLRHVYGHQASLDALHVDLCGTAEQKLDEIAPMLPLLINGAGCLAITVSDERQNTALERPAKIRKRLADIGGLAWARTFEENILCQMERIPKPEHVPRFFVGASPVKGAIKEMSMALMILQLLKQGALPAAQVSAMERFIYISRYSTKSWRMRTYLFQIERSEATVDEHAFSQAIGALWQNSPLTFVSADSITTTIEVTTSKKDVNMSAVPTAYPSLEKFIEFAKGLAPEAATEYATLRALADKAQVLETQLEDLRNSLRRLAGDGSTPVVKKTPAEESPQADSDSTPAAATTPTGVRRARIPVETPNLPNGFAHSVMMLRAKAAGLESRLGKRTVKEVVRQIKAKQKTQRSDAKKKPPQSVARAIGARTCGKHRGDFIFRLGNEVKGQPYEDTMSELAALYSTITGETVTVEMLTKEARAAARVAKTLPDRFHKTEAVPTTEE